MKDSVSFSFYSMRVYRTHVRTVMTSKEKVNLDLHYNNSILANVKGHAGFIKFTVFIYFLYVYIESLFVFMCSSDIE